MQRRWLFAAALALLASIAGCTKRRTVVGGDEALPDDQWSRGVWLYGQHCAGCHGDDGEGDDASPPLAGEGALPLEPPEGAERKQRFEHASDLFAYVSTEMPPLEPGSLAPDEYYALVRYLLQQAGRKVEVDVTASNAPSLTLR
ncbi:MAG: cytochrome c [Myxococcales bacterium]|nr:cytochrome c [Myxococcales bacterium]